MEFRCRRAWGDDSGVTSRGNEEMRFGLFGSAEAGGDRGQGFHNYINYNIEAEALGYHSSFL